MYKHTYLSLSRSVWLFKSHRAGKFLGYTTVCCESALSICTAQNCDYFSLLHGRGKPLVALAGGDKVKQKKSRKGFCSTSIVVLFI